MMKQDAIEVTMQRLLENSSELRYLMLRAGLQRDHATMVQVQSTCAQLETIFAEDTNEAGKWLDKFVEES